MPAIEVKGLTKMYGDFQALNDISFEIEKGEIVGFLGPNGAGKTTTMKILTCFMPGTSGEARVAGHDCYEEPLLVRKKIGYLPENCPLYIEMSVVEYLEYIASVHGIDYKEAKKIIKSVIYACGLEEKAYSDISDLSKGFKQRVGLASALMHDPDILILDEPTTGLDPNQRIEIKNLIKNIGEKKTVMLSSHILPEVEATCSRVIIINKGKIVAMGKPEDLERKQIQNTTINIVAKGENGDIEKILQKIEGIEKIESKGEIHKNEYGFELSVKGDNDLRKPIMTVFQRARSAELLEIYRREATLEDVFTELTK